MSNPKIIPPQGGSSTAGAEKATWRRQLARDVLLVILAREDVHVPSVMGDPTAFVRFAVKIADEFMEQAKG